ncbi:hypothetical protein D3C76_1317420 [compost metagenome]
MDPGAASVAGTSGVVAATGPRRQRRERVAGCQRRGIDQESGALADAVSGQGFAAQSLRQSRPVEHRAQSAAVAVAATAGRTRATSFERAVGLLDSSGLQRTAADSGGAIAGVIRSGRNPAHRRRPAGGQAAPVVPGAPAGAGDSGPGQLLAQHLCGGEEGFEGALSEALLAG